MGTGNTYGVDTFQTDRDNSQLDENLVLWEYVMIGYVTVGTNDFNRAIQFYDELLATIGIHRLWMHDSMAAWGPSRQQAALCVTTPFDDNVATVGNGVMIALRVGSQEEVRALHAMAVELGGQNEGEPGVAW